MSLKVNHEITDILFQIDEVSKLDMNIEYTPIPDLKIPFKYLEHLKIKKSSYIMIFEKVARFKELKIKQYDEDITEKLKMMKNLRHLEIEEFTDDQAN